MYPLKQEIVKLNSRSFAVQFQFLKKMISLRSLRTKSFSSTFFRFSSTKSFSLDKPSPVPNVSLTEVGMFCLWNFYLLIFIDLIPLIFANRKAMLTHIRGTLLGLASGLRRLILLGRYDFLCLRLSFRRLLFSTAINIFPLTCSQNHPPLST